MFLNAIIEKDEYGYFAYVPNLQRCVSQGKTYEEALANIKEATELYLESLDDDEIILLKNKISSIVPIEVVLKYGVFKLTFKDYHCSISVFSSLSAITPIHCFASLALLCSSFLMPVRLRFGAYHLSLSDRLHRLQ